MMTSTLQSTACWLLLAMIDCSRQMKDIVDMVSRTDMPSSATGVSGKQSQNVARLETNCCESTPQMKHLP